MAKFRPSRLLVTGGAGFIGSAVVREALRAEVDRVVVLDLLTYAGHRINLEGPDSDPRFVFVHGDICDAELVSSLFTKHQFDSVLHLAAESHVDRSIESAAEFIRTNVHGTFTVLEAARHAWTDARPRRFVHVSTDEVFGALGDTGAFTESSPYAPNSPYAASKAASDMLVRSYFQTYQLPAIITNTCNNYGPRQLPEKLIPLMITNAAGNKHLPVYGEGKQIREWIHVEDHATGLLAAMLEGRDGESYIFGSGEEVANLEMVHMIADAVDSHLKRSAGSSRDLIRYVQDRKGHDFRYAIDAGKARRELGWSPRRKLAEQLIETVGWYLENSSWCGAVTSSEHQRFQASHYGTEP